MSCSRNPFVDVSMLNKPAVRNTETKVYREDLLKDRYREHKIEEFTAMGKGMRSRKQLTGLMLKWSMLGLKQEKKPQSKKKARAPEELQAVTFDDSSDPINM